MTQPESIQLLLRHGNHEFSNYHGARSQWAAAAPGRVPARLFRGKLIVTAPRELLRVSCHGLREVLTNWQSEGTPSAYDDRLNKLCVAFGQSRW